MVKCENCKKMRKELQDLSFKYILLQGKSNETTIEVRQLRQAIDEYKRQIKQIRKDKIIRMFAKLIFKKVKSKM